jgi:hypothetical protein
MTERLAPGQPKPYAAPAGTRRGRTKPMPVDLAEAPSSAATYERDYYGWIQEQIALLRSGRLDRIDAENIAEELSDMGKAEFRSLESALRLVLVHMLKWDHQPGMRSRSWVVSIKTHRRRYERVLAENPSLKPRRSTAVALAYEQAVDDAAIETGLPTRTFPVECPYTLADILERPFVHDDESTG